MSVSMTKQLSRRFRRGIRGNRIEDRIVFAEGNLWVNSVNGRRRTENELLDTVRARKFQQIQGAVDVCLDIQPRLPQRRPHARAPTQMCDAIVVGICKRTLQGGAVAKVGFDNFEIGIGQVRTDIRALDRWIVKVVEVIDDGDIPRAFAEQLIDEMRADESRAAGDEDVLHAGCSLPLWGRVGVRSCVARPSPQRLSYRV